MSCDLGSAMFRSFTTSTAMTTVEFVAAMTTSCGCLGDEGYLLEGVCAALKFLLELGVVGMRGVSLLLQLQLFVA